MSLSPEQAYSTIGRTTGTWMLPRHTPAYQVRSLRFQYGPPQLERPTTGFSTD